MKLRFRSLAVLYAAVAFALALVWLSAPDRMLSAWGVSPARSNAIN